LDDHRVACASLLPAPCPSRGGEAKYLTANHLSRRDQVPAPPSARG
jgi:hypothetical protein